MGPIAGVRTFLPDVRERAAAALLGSAVGDALGATVEFLTPSEIQAQHGVLRDIQGGGWLRLPPGKVTDDTEMSLCVARSIVAVGFSTRDIGDRFVKWLRSRPIDVGNTCRRGILRYLHEGTLAAPPNEGDGGNGAAMRMAPVAIAALGDPSLLERWAIEQAHLTHNHVLSDQACLLLGRLLQQACTGRSREHMRRQLEPMFEAFPTFRFTPYRALATTYVVDTVQTVLHYFFATRTFEDCLVATVNQGGDADTTGAIVGALAGAYYGLEAIPTRWTKKLDPELVRELTRLANGLVDGSPLGQTASRERTDTVII